MNIYIFQWENHSRSMKLEAVTLEKIKNRITVSAVLANLGVWYHAGPCLTGSGPCKNKWVRIPSNYVKFNFFVGLWKEASPERKRISINSKLFSFFFTYTGNCLSFVFQAGNSGLRCLVGSRKFCTVPGSYVKVPLRPNSDPQPWYHTVPPKSRIRFQNFSRHFVNKQNVIGTNFKTRFAALCLMEELGCGKGTKVSCSWLRK